MCVQREHPGSQQEGMSLHGEGAQRRQGLKEELGLGHARYEVPKGHWGEGQEAE